MNCGSTAVFTFLVLGVVGARGCTRSNSNCALMRGAIRLRDALELLFCLLPIIWPFTFLVLFVVLIGGDLCWMVMWVATGASA